jgi:hypothetical protein
MKKWIFFPVILLIISCGKEKDEGYLTPEKALKYFSSIEEICARDGGKLWGKNLYGPLMFVDRSNRRIIANQPDSEGLLKEKNGVYTGIYPKELIITFSPARFGGVLFAIEPLPAVEDGYRIKSGAIHSLYHRYRESIGIISLPYNTNNMDEKEARLWIKLEWKALRKALESNDEQSKLAVRDALIFRGSNRELFQKFANDENRFENNEGLTTFTATLLCSGSQEEFKNRLFEYLDRIYSMQSYSRSYGYIEGALYAALLYNKGFDFKTLLTNDADLGEIVKELYNIELPAICRDVAGSLAVSYNIEEINREEDKRFSDIRDNLEKQISTFTQKPVIFLELESPYFDYEPEDIHSLDTLGTLYNSMRVSDNWGKLAVEKPGCLVASNYKFLRISAKGLKEEKNRFTGEGWHLDLNSSWEMIRVDQNYFVRKRN